MVNCQADDPGAGIFRPVCDTPQNEGDASFAKAMAKKRQWSSFNRLSIAYLRLNLLQADCSARERYLRHFARMEKVPRLGRPLRSEFALATLIRVKGSSYRWPGARMLIARTEGESARLTQLLKQ